MRMIEANRAVKEFGLTTNQFLLAIRKGWIKWEVKDDDDKIYLDYNDLKSNLAKIKQLPS